MIRKVYKSGNSIVIALPKQMLETLQVREGEDVSVELDTEHGRIVITPAGAGLDGVNAEFARQVADFIEEYRPALEALAR